MPDRLKAKVAIVIGAGSSGPGWGNGKASAVLFAREGARVLAVDVNPEAARETEEIIAGEGGDCTAHTADASLAADVEGLVEVCLERYGRIDVLHNNVGIVELGGPVEIAEENWQHLLDVNVKSVFLACKYVLPVMERQGNGAIITISSLAAIRYPGFPQASYTASKGAVIALTRNIALQYAAKGIRANCILPGLLNTPMIVKPMRQAYGGDHDEMIRQRDAQSPTGKMGDAWDIAYAALFLASDEAKYVNNVVLPVDGGLSGRFA
ncbi:MAG TPA: SDR family oxidoreductase [Alphaproteobacteria bacterium]|jgi:NAD(P)-dependent dehydrogenase (short-subunit alcohol dehydrogenase family)|nr:SDR family oxidoreductase [Alphaproteobacteria bacterium]